MTDSVPLKEWTALLVQGARDTAEARASANEAAVAIASAQLTIRLDHANGLIAMLKEREAEYARRSEVALAENGLDIRIQALERARATTGGREALTHPILMILVGAAVSAVARML